MKIHPIQTAHIENWEITERNCLVGRVSNHPQQHLFRTNLQMTSTIQRIDPEFKWAETENTRYTLGKPLSKVTVAQ